MVLLFGGGQLGEGGQSKGTGGQLPLTFASPAYDHQYYVFGQ